MKPAETSRRYFTCNYYIIGVGSKFLLSMLLLTQLLYGAHSAGPLTDPKEVNVLKILAQKMGVVTIWNFQADPCSSSFQPNVGNNYGGSFLQCNCSYDNGNLCHIIAIAIYRMNLNSQLPADVAGLTYLQFLDLNGNNLNGPIPRELGSLRNLTHLGLGTNRFIGNLPSELGNLELLTDLYVDSNELTGEIPSTLSNLRNLLNLRIYGNKHQGPLPSSLKALKGLLSMYIGDVSSGGGIPLGLSNLQNLTELSFRNCELTGNIPSELGSLKALTYLDLRFNKLTNEIPITLGRLSFLQTLYLGSNNLSGGIPQEFGALNNLRFLDVSYNNLSGSLPQWLSRSNLQEDLIWNFFNTRNFTPNFTTASDNIHVFNCRNFQPYCNRTIVGNYTEFAINVGGPKFKSSASITFDNDNETLGFATFYMSTQERWGISQGGGLGQTNFLDIVNTTTKIQGTTDSTLFQTARSSPSSIKYYGLSLLNGFYNIDLHFAEIVLPDDGLGKRVFDVFIQGKRVLKGFNIHASANGSFKALLMTFSAQVTENYLEINFFWSGKGTCCYPRRYSYGPLISAVHVYPASLDDKASQRSSHYIVVIVCIIIGALFLALVAFLRWRITTKKASHLDEKAQTLEMHQRVNLFSYKELYTATKGFQLQNKLGEGGFGVVYKGTLVDGTSVAVKQLAAISRQGDREFLNEVAVISAVQHRNLVQLRGCCLEGNRRLLVYEYLENNSLAQALFGTQIDLNLDWPKRYNIALGTARGLAYLHEESQTRIVHRDIKASNILLDKNLNPKIADFGLARLFEDGKTHISTRIAGTIGYMAPEYAMRGQLTEKADIFSFGIVLLELISGKSNVDLNLPEQCLLLDWAWQLYEENQILNLIDCKLHGMFSEEEAFRLVQVAFLCTQAVPTSRPSMTRVVAMLSGDMVITPLTTKPVFMTDVNITAHPNQRAFSSSSGSHHATIITEVEPR